MTNALSIIATMADPNVTRPLWPLFIFVGAIVAMIVALIISAERRTRRERSGR